MPREVTGKLTQPAEHVPVVRRQVRVAIGPQLDYPRLWLGLAGTAGPRKETMCCT
jgi:hypothetical protein